MLSFSCREKTVKDVRLAAGEKWLGWKYISAATVTSAGRSWNNPGAYGRSVPDEICSSNPEVQFPELSPCDNQGGSQLCIRCFAHIYNVWRRRGHSRSRIQKSM